MSMSIDKIPHVLDWFSTFSGSETRLEIVTDLSLLGAPDHNAEEFFKLRKQLEQYLGRDADIDIAFHYKERPSIGRCGTEPHYSSVCITWTTASNLLWTLNFCLMRETCCLIVPTCNERFSPISLLVSPCKTNP